MARSLFLHVCLSGALSVGIGTGLALWSAGRGAATARQEHAIELVRSIAATLPVGLVGRAVEGGANAKSDLEIRLRQITGSTDALAGVSLAWSGSPASAPVLLVGDAPDVPEALLVDLVTRAHRDRTCVVATASSPRLLAVVPTAAVSGRAAAALVFVLAERHYPQSPLSYWPLVVGVLLAVAGAAVVRHRFGMPIAKARLQDTELEQRVAVRTRDLVNLNRLQEEQVANTVHELRTPLTTILASLSILHEGVAETEAERTQFLENAITATRHMTFLCNDILDTAAFEAGKLRMDLGPCNVRDLLTEAESLMRPIAMSRDVELRVEAPDQHLTAIGDRGRVMQVIFNLVSNAVKYSPAGRQVILRAQAATTSLAFEVEDEGIGVPVAARGMLFTKFSRVHDNDSTVPGTGIGLYLCRILVEHMDGSIGFDERETGTGSVFWFTLPMLRSSIAPPIVGGVLTSSRPS